MVKKQKKDSRKKRNRKRFNGDFGRTRKINASTAVETCIEQLLLRQITGMKPQSELWKQIRKLAAGY